MKRQPPFDPATARYLLALAGKSQKDIARRFEITEGAVTRILNGESYSQRVWDYHALLTSKVRIPIAS